MKTCGGVEVCFTILGLFTRWSWVGNLTSGLLYTPPLYVLDRRLCGPPSWFGCCGEEKKILPLPGIVQPMVCCFADCTTLAPINKLYQFQSAFHTCCALLLLLEFWEISLNLQFNYQVTSLKFWAITCMIRESEQIPTGAETWKDGLDSIDSEHVHYIMQVFWEHRWSGCILSETWK